MPLLVEQAIHRYRVQARHKHMHIIPCISLPSLQNQKFEFNSLKLNFSLDFPCRIICSNSISNKDAQKYYTFLGISDRNSYTSQKTWLHLQQFKTTTCCKQNWQTRTHTHTLDISSNSNVNHTHGPSDHVSGLRSNPTLQASYSPGRLHPWQTKFKQNLHRNAWHNILCKESLRLTCFSLAVSIRVRDDCSSIWWGTLRRGCQ